MDITARYRTKYPPKEHEEAVRMLLENIASKQAPQDDFSKVETKTDRYDYDQGSMISNGSASSSDRALVRSNSNITTSATSKVINGKNHSQGHNRHHHHNHHHHHHHQSNKATSTSDSVSTGTSSSVGHETEFKEPIPSRTIAVQCDLKSSSLKRDHLFDTSMQASSISSTRYGFYNFTPETLAQRRKLERSVSNRDVNRSTTPYGLSPSQQVEAPTSMSELSSSLSASDYELNENKHRTDRYISNNNNNNNGNLKSSTPSYGLAEDSRRLQRGGKQYRENGNMAPQYTSMVDNSTGDARVSTLPRRPVTALSYVSTTKLRDQQQQQQQHQHSDCSSDHESDDQQSRSKSIQRTRAMSQQNLIRPRTPAPGVLQATSSSSSSDLGIANSAGSGVNNRSSMDQQSINFQGDRSTDEVLVSMKRSRDENAPSKPPRPTLISSAHNEQVRDFRTTISARQLSSGVERSNLDSASDWQDNESGNRLPAYARNINKPVSQIGSAGLMRKPSRVLRDTSHVYDENCNSCSEQQMPSYWKAPSMAAQQANETSQLLNGQYFHLSEDERRHEPSRYQAKLNGNQVHSSMSLSRGRSQASMQPQQTATTTGGYYTSARKSGQSTLNNRAISQTLLADSQRYAANNELGRRNHRWTGASNGNSSNEVCRSTSMRQIGRPGEARYSEQAQHYQGEQLHGLANQNGYMEQDGANERELFEAGRAWRDAAHSGDQTNNHLLEEAQSKVARKCSRSRSMRNVYDPTRNAANDLSEPLASGQREYYSSPVAPPPPPPTTNLNHQYHSSSESSVLDTAAMGHRFTRAQPLDYDSQHRLNESGLPEIASMTLQAPRKVSAPSSYMGVAGGHHIPASYTLGRSAQIRGRAMSQQSLSRPQASTTMAGRRRRAAATGSNSGSDVGGSSMSLVSRLNGRYENAHTRNPVVMYIPQVTQKLNQSSDLLASKSSLDGAANKSTSSLLRKSSRSRLKSSSQDRSKRSLSRNGSDSESSSMLRTLLRPKSRHQANNVSKRRLHNIRLDSHHNNNDNYDEEDLDRIGQLATELDSYKFRRRYSVPKDAKINWFAKLKQKVVSSGGR